MRNKELDKEKWNALRAYAMREELPERTDLSFADRLKYALLRLSIDYGSDEKIEEVIGRSMKQLGRYVESEDLPFSVLAKLSKYSRVPLGWLAENQAPYARRSETTDGQDNSFAFVPKLQIKASAGGGALAFSDESDGMLAFRMEWLRRRGINPAAAAVLTAIGDSNEPTIRDGDTLLVDTSIREIRDNGFYIVVISEMVFVKRVHVSLDGSVTLLSDNRVYPPETVSKADVQSLYLGGRVMWFGRAL